MSDEKRLELLVRDVIASLDNDGNLAWRHRCSDGVGGCNAIGEHIIDRFRELLAELDRREVKP